MGELKATQAAQESQRPSYSLNQMLTSNRFKDNLARIVPSHVNSERFAVVAMRQLAQIPKLYECTPESVIGSFMQAGALGLEVGVNGECWILPYKGVAQLQIGYLGHMKLAWNSSRVASIFGDVVTHDEVREERFEYQQGTSPYIRHKPMAERVISEKTVAFAYGIVWVKDSDVPIWRVIDHRRIEKLRNTGQSANSPAWRDHYGEMAIAKALKLALKWAPKDREQATAIALDDQADGGARQIFNLDPEMIETVTGQSMPIDITPAGEEEPNGSASSDPKEQEGPGRSNQSTPPAPAEKPKASKGKGEASPGWE